jgi:Predicted periplasmic protein (DUF2271)
MSTAGHRRSEDMPRRVFLRRAFTAVGGLCVTAVATACGANKPKAVATTSAPATSATATTMDHAMMTTVAPAATPATTAKSGVTAAGATSTAPAAAAAKSTAAGGAVFDATKELAISFSYVADTTGGGGPAGGNPPGGGNAPLGGGPGGGRVNNPYVAVWIENAESLPVRTISLNYQIGRGDRWLNELQRWFRNEQVRLSRGGASAIETISSATRVPGAYKVVWDGLDNAKKPVARRGSTSYVWSPPVSTVHTPWCARRSLSAPHRSPKLLPTRASYRR